jgi:SPP1 family phage portal protein
LVKLADKLIEYVKEQIENFSDIQKQMIIGERYFNQENDIINRKKIRGAVSEADDGPVYHNVTDTTRANHRLPSGFMRQQVLQKVNYLINDNITVDDQIEDIELILPEWKRDLKRTGIKASQQIYAVWQWYIKDNVLKYKIIPPQQIIIDYDEDDKDDIQSVIRYYTKDSVDIAELYTDTEKIVFERKKNKKWQEVSRGGHFTEDLVDANGRVLSSSTKSFGRPPFSIMYNNDEMNTDVQPIKPFIDIYDITNSDFANNIDDFQEIITILKGYGGDNPAQFLNQMKLLGAVPIDEDGDVEFKQGIIPVEARKEFLQMTRKNIFEFGMAVDVQEIAAGNATNVAIQSMYENLNMKASQFEQELQDFWKQTLYFINMYYGVGIDNELVFDKKMLSNQKDTAEINKIEVETAAMLSAFFDDEALSNLISNLQFIKDKSDLSTEEILASVRSKSDDFMIPGE